MNAAANNLDMLIINYRLKIIIIHLNQLENLLIYFERTEACGSPRLGIKLKGSKLTNRH